MSERNGGQPSGWVKATLAEVTSASRAKAEPGNFGDVPYIGLEHIEGGSNRILSVGTVADVKSTKSVFQGGDVLYGKLRPYLKKVCRPDFDGVCSTDILVFSESPNIDNGYLLYFLSQQPTADYAIQNSNGINLPRISSRALGEIEFPLPPLAEQRRIVAKIEALQERSRRAREALLEVGPLLEQFWQSVLAAAFRGDLTADWRAAHPNVEPASALLSQQHPLPDLTLTRRRIQKKGTVTIPGELFHELPSTWSYATVQQCLDQGILIDFVDGNHGALYPRKNDFGDKGVIFVTATQLQNGIVDFETAPRLHDEKARQLQKGWATGGDILLTHNATVGRTARVPVDIGSFLLGTSVTYYRANPVALDRNYLYYVLSAPQWQGQLESIMEQTTRNQVSIQKQAFFRIPMAPHSEQHAIARMLDACFEWLQNVAIKAEESLRDLEKFDESILAKAFRGELVPQDPSDEPPSVLLERIRSQPKRQAKAPKQTSKSHQTSKLGKNSSRLEPQQLTLAEVLRTAD